MFNNVTLDGVETAVAGSNCAVIFLNASAPKSGITIKDCEINNGSIGVCKSGMSADAPDTKTILSGNLFFNQQQGGISLTNEDAPEIVSNVVSSTSSSETFKAISLINASNQIIVTKNVVNAPNGAIGLALTNCEASATNLGQITNNSIVAGGSGISLNGSTDNQILNFNRVKLSMNGGNKSYYANGSTGNNINMMNNIFYDLATGGYTIIGNSYKDFFNQLPGQSNSAMTASANAITVEKVFSIK